jgi:hypothetical protein
MEIEIMPWEYEYASFVGIRRFTANWSRNNAKHYDAKRMEDDRTAQVAAAITELAVAKHTNRYWHASIWHSSEHIMNRDLPDVGRNIEVRRVRQGHCAAVRRHQLNKGLVLWAGTPHPPEFRFVTLHGWLHNDDAWNMGTPADYDLVDTRLIPLTLLNHP